MAKISTVGSALANIIGTLLLFYAFSVGSTDVSVVKDAKGQVFFCLKDAAAFGLSPVTRSIVFDTGACRSPEQAAAGRVAMINTDRPNLALLGLLLVVASSILSVIPVGIALRRS